MNSRVSEKECSTLSNIYTALITILPITSVYAVPFLSAVSLGELLLILLIPLMLIVQVKKGTRLNLKNPLLIYLFYALVSTMFASTLLQIVYNDYDISNMIFRVVRDLFYFLLILLWGKDFFNFTVGKKFLMCISKVASIFMIIQFVVYQFFNISIPGYIPGIKTTISGGILSNELVDKFLNTALQDGYLRVYGFFSEPAAAAQFLSVALLLIFFFAESNRIDFKWAIILSVAIVLTFSVSGYITLIFCWGIMFIKAKKSKKTKNICIIIAAFLCLLVPFALVNDNIKGVFLRLVSLFNGENTQNSAALRVLRGPAFFLDMPLFYQIFGSGFGNFDDFKAAYMINTVYEQTTEYLNTNAYVAISSGVIGLLLYIRGIWKNTKGKRFFAKTVALLVFLLGFACSLYSSPIYVIYLLLIINCPKEGVLYDKHNNIA